MMRILFAASPIWGHISPTVAIAQRLQSQGHEVAYASHPQLAPLLKRAGLHLLEEYCWGDLMVRLGKDIGTRKDRWVALFRGTRGWPPRVHFDGLDQGTENLINLMGSWKPDVLVSDLLFHPGPIAAEACRLPYATYCPIALPLPSSALPPYGFGLPPTERFSLRRGLGRIVLCILARSGDWSVNARRRRHGLTPVRGGFFYPSPYLFLAFVTEALEYPRPDLPPQVFFVGPPLSEERGDADGPFPWEWLDGRSLVYASLGTINTGQTEFFDNVIEASRGQPWQAVISIGRYLNAERWSDLPENVLLRNYVPQPALLRRARAVISHGGVNTVNETLAAGLPLAVVPISADQFENAQRVVEAGAGLRLKLSRASAPELRFAVHRLLGDKSLRENAERIAADYARCDGAAASAALILRLAETRAAVLRRPGRRPTIYADEIDSLENALADKAVQSVAGAKRLS